MRHSPLNAALVLSERVSMAVGIKVGCITDEIGTPDFFHAFFSTVSANLEVNGWGTRFPILMGKLYQGRLEPNFADIAIMELRQIQRELCCLTPDKVVWDIESRSKLPPWGQEISPDIRSLGDYFITSTGRDLISTLIEALEDASTNLKSVLVVEY